MPLRQTDRLRVILRLALAAIYLGVGFLHLSAPDRFLAIMPPVILFPRAVVLFTGACEVAGAIGLLLPPTRRLAGTMLAIYAVCVWPANIYQALAHIHAPPLPESWWYHGPRIAFQPVLVWWALFAGAVVDWPFRNALGRDRGRFGAPRSASRRRT
jgi:uncharacterized membrane protein